MTGKRNIRSRCPISRLARRLVAIGLLTLGCWQPAESQTRQKVTLDLDRTIRLATDSSLAAQKYHSVYDAARYQYLSWMASRKPQVSLKGTPLQYEQYIAQRYLSEENRDIYREQKLLIAKGGINVEQVMEPWGGTFYGNTALGYMKTFGEGGETQFTTVPINIGYRQQLLGFNALKWNRRLEPIKMKAAEKQLTYDIETTSEKAVERFFELALAQEQYRIAEEYLQSCDTTFAIAKRRFHIASIPKAELDILELTKINAQNALANARIAHQKASRRLASLLGMNEDTEIVLRIPTEMANLTIDAAEAIAEARENNPQYVSQQEKTEEARRDAAKAKIDKGLSVNVDASIGLNQVASRLSDAYRRPLVQDMAVITLSIPLKDWGKGRNNYLAAKSKVEAAERSAAEGSRDTELEVSVTVAEFNERQAIVETARHALTIAEDAYAAMMRRFMNAQATVNDITLTQTHWQTALQNQITSLQHYWQSYYHLRLLTLYDFQKREKIVHTK